MGYNLEQVLIIYCVYLLKQNSSIFTLIAGKYEEQWHLFGDFTFIHFTRLSYTVSISNTILNGTDSNSTMTPLIY